MHKWLDITQHETDLTTVVKHQINASQMRSTEGQWRRKEEKWWGGFKICISNPDFDIDSIVTVGCSDTCATAAEASELPVVAIRRCDLSAFNSSFSSQHAAVNVGAINSSNRRRVNNTSSVSTDDSWSPVSQSNGSMTGTMELRTSCTQNNAHTHTQLMAKSQ